MITATQQAEKLLAETLAELESQKGRVLINGHKVGGEQHINRLRAFMSATIESESNQAIAKTHVDYLGSYLEKVYKISNKDVHSELSRLEAVKAVFHTYLVVADILEYLQKDVKKIDAKLNIHAASLDELESILGISRNAAKEIVKRRVENGILDLHSLRQIKGVGKKALSLAEEKFSFDPSN